MYFIRSEVTDTIKLIIQGKNAQGPKANSYALVAWSVDCLKVKHARGPAVFILGYHMVCMTRD